MTQGTTICSHFVSSGHAIGILITGKIIFLIGFTCLIAFFDLACLWDTYYYYPTACDSLAISSGIFLVLGTIIVAAGTTVYCKIRKNPIRVPPASMPLYIAPTTGLYPNGTTAYPAAIPGMNTAYPATLVQGPAVESPNNTYQSPPPYMDYPGQHGTQAFHTDQNSKVQGYPRQPAV